jgi:cell division transport system permease protein
MAFARATRGFREDLKLYLVAVSSLTVAFLCLATTLLAVENLSRVADAWGASRRMSVYLVDGADRRDIEQLEVVLEGLPEVQAVEHVTAARARELFLEQSGASSDLGALPTDVFPASLDVTLTADVTVQRMSQIAERVERFGSVDDVETYSGFFGQLESLISTGRGLTLGLALLVVFCVIAVVGNTIRLALASRRQEIEVMKLCGATDSFVRSPFVVEGAVSGFMAALAAVTLLGLAFLALRGQVDGSIASLTGTHATFLDAATVLAMVLGGALVGAMGSALSLRRYLTI